MRFEAYIILLFCMSMTLYILGYESPLMHVWSMQGETSLQPLDILSLLADTVLSDIGLLALGIITAVGVVASLLAGFGATFLIPLLILTAIMTYVVFPISFIFDPSLPILLKAPVLVLFNILTIFSIVDFMRGRS